MKKILFSVCLSLTFLTVFGQGTLTADANGYLNITKLISNSSSGQTFFTAHQFGSAYSYSNGMFRAITDNPNGAGNYFYDGVTNGVTTYSVRADGQSFFGGSMGIGTTSPSVYSGYSGITTNNATNGGFIDFRQNGALRGLIYADASGLTLQAQPGLPLHLNSNGSEKITILSNGNIGINQMAPLTTLHVNGSMVTGAGSGNLDPSQSTGNISYLSGTGLMLMGWNKGLEGESDFVSNRGPSTANGGFAFFDYSNSGTQTELMRIRSGGQVLIGVSNFSLSQAMGSNMLGVGGGIIADAVTVKLQSGWADYVFDKDYKLPSLNSVQAYILKNHHLPDVPSANDVEISGQNLGDMNKLLLKKVEELTLYLIDQNNQLKEQQNINASLQDQINGLIINSKK